MRRAVRRRGIQARVDTDHLINAQEAEQAPDRRRGDHHAWLAASGGGPLLGPVYRSRACAVTEDVALMSAISVASWRAAEISSASTWPALTTSISSGSATIRWHDAGDVRPALQLRGVSTKPRAALPDPRRAASGPS